MLSAIIRFLQAQLLCEMVSGVVNPVPRREAEVSDILGDEAAPVEMMMSLRIPNENSAGGLACRAGTQVECHRHERSEEVDKSTSTPVDAAAYLLTGLRVAA